MQVQGAPHPDQSVPSTPEAHGAARTGSDPVAHPVASPLPPVSFERSDHARQATSLLTVLALVAVVVLSVLLLIMRRVRTGLRIGDASSGRRKKPRRRPSAWEESERRFVLNKPAGLVPGSDDDTVDIDPSDLGPEDIGPGDRDGRPR